MVEGGGEDKASVRAPAVFISYASQDAAAAGRICSALRQFGIEVWFDQNELRGGDVWDQRIRREIRDCTLFMPVISANTASRHEGYFRLEWDLADRRTHMMARDRAFIVPVCLDATKEAGTDVPESFHRVQWTRLLDGNTPPEFIARIVALLGAHGAAVSGAESTQPTERTAHGAPPALTLTVRPKSTLRKNRLVIAVTAAIMLMLAYVAIDRLLLPKHTPAEKPAAAVAPAPTPAIPEKSVAVLPFVDMSEKKDQEYFADGMAEEILDLLAKLPRIRVIGRTSSFQFKGKSEDLRVIGTKLNAAHILEGSVRKSGDQVRVTAQLVNTATGVREWSETYDRRIGDVLKLQDAVAASVVRELQLTVAPGQLNSRSILNDTDAYELILRGRHALDRYDAEGFAEAATLFQQALDRDPTSGDAAAALAYVYEKQGTWEFVTPVVGFEQARRAASTALRLDPKNSLAHLVLGRFHQLYDWDWAAAERELRQAAILAPGNADALNGQAWLSVTLGRWDDALRQIKAALARDPLDPNSYENLTWVHLGRGDLADAEAAMRRGLDIRRTYGWGHFILGVVLLERGEREAALVEMQQETIDEGQQAGLAMAYYALGRRTDSDAALSHILNVQTANNAFGIANAYAWRGQRDQAFHWLDRAYTAKSSLLVYLKSDPVLTRLAADPRYKAFLRKMKLPE